MNNVNDQFKDSGYVPNQPYGEDERELHSSGRPDIDISHEVIEDTINQHNSLSRKLINIHTL